MRRSSPTRRPVKIAHEVTVTPCNADTLATIQQRYARLHRRVPRSAHAGWVSRRLVRLSVKDTLEAVAPRQSGKCAWCLPAWMIFAEPGIPGGTGTGQRRR